ncbi:junctional adhesion molecule A-like [Discoglossus pictus]
MEETRGASVILSFGLVLSLIVGSLASGGVTTPNPEIQVKEGESTDLRCFYPSSLTNPRVEWKFVSNDQTRFVYYDGALTAPYKDRAIAYLQGIQLKSITRKDDGEYICEVTATDANGSATLGEAKIKLIVLGSLASGGVTTPNPEIQVKEGESTDLRCVYPSSLTNPRVEWKFVSNDQTRFIYYDGALTAPYKDRAIAYHQGIQLKGITRKDDGEYICEVTATDANGSATLGEAKIKLIVLGNHLKGHEM